MLKMILLSRSGRIWEDSCQNFGRFWPELNWTHLPPVSLWVCWVFVGFVSFVFLVHQSPPSTQSHIRLGTHMRAVQNP